jgi:hypothetical protein
MRQPKGFEKKGKESWLCRLLRTLYGLRQAPAEFNADLHHALELLGWIRSSADPCVYLLVKPVEDNGPALLCVHVDDQCFAGTEACYDWLKLNLSEKFTLDDRGVAKQVVGLDVHQSALGIHLSQKQYVRVLLEKANLGEKEPSVRTPWDMSGKVLDETPLAPLEAKTAQSLNGGLMWLSVNTRLDISEAVRQISRSMHAPHATTMRKIKRVLRYLEGTKDLGIMYSRKTVASWYLSYCDASGANDFDRRSVSGYITLVLGAPVDWFSRTQKVVSLDMCGAEYVSTSTSVRESVWLYRLLIEMLGCVASGVVLEPALNLWTDNTAAIKVASDRRVYKGIKHLETKFHFIREMIEKGHVTLSYVDTLENLADLLTKSLPRVVFLKFRNQLMVEAKHLISFD